MDAIWDGVTRTNTLNGRVAPIRQALADAARGCDWFRVLDLISAHRDYVNCTRLDGTSLSTPLHQAAHGGAPVEVARRLIELGAWRTLRNAEGDRPVDVAARRRHGHLLDVLTPEYKHHVPLDILAEIQRHFHALIRERAERDVEAHALRLPELEPLLELERPFMWFPVPGMCGGFSFGLEETGHEAKLIASSWCRIVGGSGQCHEITVEGCTLIDEGFV